MAKYIDAEGVMRACFDSFLKTGNKAYSEIIALVEAVPAADVVEVRHGRWIREPNCYYRCSVCGDHHPCIKSNMDYNYCPNCGAKMDEE